MIQHGKAPFLECSSKGHKCFSAFYARIPRCGNRTIEDIYQASKVFEEGLTGLSIKEAKGRKAINMEECASLYSRLWDEYIEENKELGVKLMLASGLSDMFGQARHVCQATELWRIRNQLLARKELHEDFELWLKAAYCYYHLYEIIMPDAVWDQLGRKLSDRWEEWSHPAKALVEKEGMFSASHIPKGAYPSYI